MNEKQKRAAIEAVRPKTEAMTCPNCGHAGLIVGDYYTEWVKFNGGQYAAPESVQFCPQCPKCRWNEHDGMPKEYAKGEVITHHSSERGPEDW